ncbi:MAG: ankyrin repeat domain-containing protein [Deltaproteobacteria bacterium]
MEFPAHDNPIDELLAALRIRDDEAATRVARTMLSMGSDLAPAQVDGAPLLHAAAELDLRGLVSCLLDEAGADLRATEQGQYTAIDAAVRGGALHTARLLFERGLRPAVDVFDLVKGDAPNLVQPVRTLVQLDAALVRKVDDFGYTLLHWASAPAMARALLEAGADVDAANPRGVRPLQIAVMNHYPIETIQALIEAGPELDAEMEEGQTALYWATKDGRVDVVRLLLRVGADPGRGSSRASMQTTASIASQSSNAELRALFGLHSVATQRASTTPNPLGPLERRYGQIGPGEFGWWAALAPSDAEDAVSSAASGIVNGREFPQSMSRCHEGHLVALAKSAQCWASLGRHELAVRQAKILLAEEAHRDRMSFGALVDQAFDDARALHDALIAQTPSLAEVDPLSGTSVAEEVSRSEAAPVPSKPAQPAKVRPSGMNKVIAGTIIIVALIGLGLVVLSQGSALAPFLYTLF